MVTIDKTALGEDVQRWYEAELVSIERERLLSRLWANDVTLWPCEEFGPHHARENLEFLHIPERLPQLTAGGSRANAEAAQDGMTDRMLISFGTVHHFCNAILDLHPGGKNLNFLALDNCHPELIRKAEARLELRKALLILVNKSGYSIEDHALFLYFQSKLSGAQEEVTGRHFAAATDPNSYLARMAIEYKFRYLLEMPTGILAPYCSVLFLALFLQAVARVEPPVLRATCREMKKEYSGTQASAGNPVCELAAFLSATAKSGRRFVSFLASPELEAFATALCPLVGGSLGREQGGLFPLTNAPPCTNQGAGKESSFVVFRRSGEKDPQMKEWLSILLANGLPFLEMTVLNPLDLLRQTYAWQIATALAAARMGIYPFRAQDPRLPLNLATEALNRFSAQNDTLQRRPRIQEGALQLFAEGKARHEVSQLNLVESLRSLFQNRESGSYVSLFVFLEQTEELQKVFGSLRKQIAEKLGLPVLLGWGPRSVDTYAHFLREGAPQGLHLVITGETSTDIKVPGANYKFGELYLALALGQFGALSSLNGLALRLHLRTQSPEGQSELQDVVTRALKRAGS